MRKLIFFLALLLPFISSKVDAEDKKVKVYDTGTVDMMIIPIYE